LTKTSFGKSKITLKVVQVFAELFLNCLNYKSFCSDKRHNTELLQETLRRGNDPELQQGTLGTCRLR
jgi:hypothetical protein